MAVAGRRDASRAATRLEIFAPVEYSDFLSVLCRQIFDLPPPLDSGGSLPPSSDVDHLQVKVKGLACEGMIEVQEYRIFIDR